MAKKTPSGKFRGKVTIGYAPDGKPIYKYVTAPTRRELENVKEAVREHYIFGRAIPRDVQFYEYAGQWYKTKKEPVHLQRQPIVLQDVLCQAPSAAVWHAAHESHYGGADSGIRQRFCRDQQVSDQQRHRDTEGDLCFGLCGRAD